MAPARSRSSGNNTFSGGITIDAGTLELADSNSAGTGDITFIDPPTVTRTLKIDLGDDPPEHDQRLYQQR